MPATHDRPPRSVGEHHTTDAAGLCLETCPHPDHDGPVVVAMPAPLKVLFDEWLSSLGTTSTHIATAPGEDGMRTYVVRTAGTPAEAATTPSNLDTFLRGRAATAAARRAAESDPRRQLGRRP